MTPTPEQAPKPIDAVADEGESQAFIPYPPIGRNLEHVPIHVRPDVFYYQARMGFLPNAIKLYLHIPWSGQRRAARKAGGPLHAAGGDGDRAGDRVLENVQRDAQRYGSADRGSGGRVHEMGELWQAAR